MTSDDLAISWKREIPLDLPVPTLAQSDSTEATVVSSACAKMGPLVTRGRDSAHAVRDMSESFAKKNVLMELTG